MPETSCDILLRGGRVIAPGQSLNGVMDVAIKDGKILAIGQDLPLTGTKTVDASGYIVTPGLIDMHCHCYPTFPFAADSLPTIHPDAHMFRNGVTTAVDAGTCGWVDFPQMKKEIIDKAEVRVLAFLNISDGGMVHMTGEDDPSTFHPGIVSEVAKAYSDVVVGIKTAHYWVHKPFDRIHTPWASVDAMVEAGEKSGKICMADFQPTLPGRTYQELLLEHLRPGDIHTHMYAQQFPVLDEKGKVNSFLWEARKRGIRFDLGHGAGSFWFRNAIPACQQGHVPDTLSTDLYVDNVSGPVIGLLHVMSKFLSMGMPLEDVIRKATCAPADVIGHPELGSLKEGGCADLALLKIRREPTCFADSGHARMHGDQTLECACTIRGGNIVYDPHALFMPDWETAPEAYWVAPGVL